MSRSKTIVDESDVLIPISGFERVTGYERTTAWRHRNDPEWPQPIYVGNRRMYRLGELKAWVEAQAARPAEARPRATNLRGRAA